MQMKTFNNGRLWYLWLYGCTGLSVNVGLGCCGLGETPAFSVTIALLKAAYAQTQRYVSEPYFFSKAVLITYNYTYQL